MIPVGKNNQSIYIVEKDIHGNVIKNSVLPVRYVPLTDREKQAKSDL
jgi:protein-L-isoaspartate O-methyltransferase